MLLTQASTITLNASHLIPMNLSSILYIALSCATVGIVLQDPSLLQLCCRRLPLRLRARLQWQILTHNIEVWLQHMQKYLGSFSKTTRKFHYKSVCSPKLETAFPTRIL